MISALRLCGVNIKIYTLRMLSGARAGDLDETHEAHVAKMMRLSV